MGWYSHMGSTRYDPNQFEGSVVTIALTQQASRDLAEFWLNSTLLCWAHFAPVCGTASRTAEIDTGDPNQPRPLRSNEAPDGLPDLRPSERRRVELANILYDWACAAFLMCVQKGILATLVTQTVHYFG